MADLKSIRIIISVTLGVFFASVAWAQYSSTGTSRTQGDPPVIKDKKGQADATPIPLPGPGKQN